MVMKNADLINEFLEQKVIDSLSTLLSSDDINDLQKAAAVVAAQFGSDYEELSNGDIEKFIQSFKKNLTLLIQKTWVEQSDIMLKEEILAKLEKFCAALAEDKWAENYKAFHQINDAVLSLMFGQNAKTPDFEEYALRIDPEFGIYYWYEKSLPESNTWSNEKNKILILVAMYFLANY